MRTKGKLYIDRIASNHVVSGQGRSVCSAGGYTSNVNPEQVYQENRDNTSHLIASWNAIESIGGRS